MIAKRQQFLSSAGNAPTPAARVIRIALLGCGTVGGAALRLLQESRDRLCAACGIDLQVVAILVRDARRTRPNVDARLTTDSFDDVLRAEPDLVIEALGGREPAGEYLTRMLERGISVVSANKTLISHDGPSLEAIAERSGARLAYEASVAAAIPVLAAIRQRATAGDPVVAIRAVLNGTCNFILSRMRETGLGLHAVLKEAVEHGFAETDPSADISGRDTAEKLCILARAVGITHISPGEIPVTGIENITPRDLDAAREQGCVVKLVAELGLSDAGEPRLRVGPMFVPLTHPLAKVKGAQNVIVIDQEFAGRLVLQGEGAGPKATAAAILGDVLNVLDAKPIASRPIQVITTATSHRLFVRLPTAHPSAASLRSRADHVQVHRDRLELIVDDVEIPAPNQGLGDFAARMLDDATPAASRSR